MSKEKLKLKTLTVQSFVVSVKKNKANTIRGGSVFVCSGGNCGRSDWTTCYANTQTEDSYSL